jgi:hypothetical protein
MISPKIKQNGVHEDDSIIGQLKAAVSKQQILHSLYKLDNRKANPIVSFMIFNEL